LGGEGSPKALESDSGSWPYLDGTNIYQSHMPSLTVQHLASRYCATHIGITPTPPPTTTSKVAWCLLFTMQQMAQTDKSLNSTWLVTSRLDTTRHVRRVERVETSVSSKSSRGVPTWRTTNKL